MFSKIAVLCALVAVSVAMPDKPSVAPRGYAYQAPATTFTVVRSYEESVEDSYEAPPQRTYVAPAPTYTAPEDSYEAPPQRTYVAPAPSAPAPRYTAPDSSEEEETPLMPYDFGYIVDDDESDNAYGHKTTSDGEQVTGQYRVLLPDGRTQIVTYIVTKEDGYQAEVTYEGEARPYVAPEVDSDEDDLSYQPPRSSYNAPN